MPLFPAPHPSLPPWSRLLGPLSPLWGATLRARAALHAHHLLGTTRLSKPVISVGNIVLGGTGKTPTVAALAEEILRRGKLPCLLSRGYGREGRGRVVVGRGKGAEVQARVGGDEPVLLAQRIRRMPVVVDANRASAGQWAERELSPDVFLLDDGFQHLALERDRNVVLLSPSDPLGGGALPPAGLLREPAEALARATHGVVLCSPGEDPSRALDALHRFAPAAVATVAVRRTIGPFTPSGDPVDRAPLAPLRLLAVTGTAKPDGAFRAMRDLGLRIEETLPFSDHHRYGPDDFARIGRILDEKQLDGVVTTGKDAVKFGAEVGFPWWWIDVAVDGDWSGILDVLDEWEVRA